MVASISKHLIVIPYPIAGSIPLLSITLYIFYACVDVNNEGTPKIEIPAVGFAQNTIKIFKPKLLLMPRTSETDLKKIMRIFSLFVKRMRNMHLIILLQHDLDVRTVTPTMYYLQVQNKMKQ